MGLEDFLLSPMLDHLYSSILDALGVTGLTTSTVSPLKNLKLTKISCYLSTFLPIHPPPTVSCNTQFKDVCARNVPTYRFLLNLPRRKVMIYFCQKGKKWSVSELVFEIMRCTFRSLHYFKTILAYNCQQPKSFISEI